MRYVDSVRGGLICTVVIFLIAVFVPGHGPSQDIELILTISTFVFAILVGFFIARASSRFSEMRDAVAQEDALFFSFYKTAQAQGAKFTAKIRVLIDRYYRISYDNELTNYTYKETIPIFLQMWDETTRLRPKKPEAYDQLLDLLADIESSRNAASSISKEKINRGQWMILLVLSMIILGCLFYLKNDQAYSIVVTILLSSSLVIVVLLLRDLQNFKYGLEGGLLEESGEEVFDAIGVLRYYHQQFLKSGHQKIPSHIKRYRMGVHKPGERPKIRVMQNEKITKGQR